MSKRAILLAVTLILVLGIFQTTAAWGMGYGDGGQLMSSTDKWVHKYDALNLTEQQKAKMREIDQETYTKVRDLRIKLMDCKHELKQLQLQPNPDSAKIEAKINEIKELKEQIHGIVQQGRQQCRSLLTPEQQEKIKQFKGHKGGAKANWNR